MRYNPRIHKRHSIRLRGYDYSQEGLYFITICCQHGAHLFGQVQNAEMIPNAAGEMVAKWYYALESRHANIRCHDMVVMPNHFHCIIEIIPTPNATVGADQCVCPNADQCACPNADQCACPTPEQKNKQPILGEHIGSPLHRVLQWFKTMTTNEYIRQVKNADWLPFDGRLWQRNYYEHIIRDERAYVFISAYILQNPAKWQKDKFYKQL